MSGKEAVLRIRGTSLWKFVCVFSLLFATGLQAHDKSGHAHLPGPQNQVPAAPSALKPPGTQQPDERIHHKAPEEVVKRYLKAIYARDYPDVYRWISHTDRRLKTRTEYVREHGTFSGATLELARTLANLVRFEQIETELHDNMATVTATVRLPNANDPQIQALTLEFDEDRVNASSPQAQQAMGQQIGELARTGHLPTVVATSETWQLMYENGAWGIVMNWEGAVEVRFEAVTRAGLPWAFTPVQPLVRILPGEALQTFYQVKNLSSRTITGKARHILEPPEDVGFTEIVSCFCFFEQTLEPGEEQELSVFFRVNPELPEAIREMRVLYEFYPIEDFPKEAKQR